MDFNTKAFALLGALPAFVTEANAQASGLDAAVAAAGLDADAAAMKAGEALTSADNAALSKTGADSARDAAVLAKNAAEAALDSFDDRYLGAKAVAPTLDNDGNALLIGALYWDTALPGMRSWNGSAWVTLPAATAAAISNTPAGSIAATTVQSAIDELGEEKAPLSSPALTGTPLAPTPPTADNSARLATTAFVQRQFAAGYNGNGAYFTAPGFQMCRQVMTIPANSNALWTFPLVFTNFPPQVVATPAPSSGSPTLAIWTTETGTGGVFIGNPNGFDLLINVLAVQ